VRYVDSVLLTDERVICSARVHWIVFVPAGFCFFVLLMGLAATAGEKGESSAALAAVAWPGIILLLWAWTIRESRELALTTRRVIARTGFIRREIVELNLTQVESFNLEQGILGRLFGYGTIRITGAGGVHVPIARLADPREFCREAAIASDIAQSRETAKAKAA
jgi:uncharacterized membrane protein YdbT with pleckstrin-like domain